MQRLLKILIVLVIANCFVQVVVSQGIIEFEISLTGYGNELKDKIHYNKKLASPDEVKAELGNIYRQLHGLGFLELKKDSCHHDSVSVCCVLKPGKRFRYFISPGNIGEEALTYISHDTYFRPSGITPGKYEDLAKEVLGFFENNGYPFASVGLSDLKIRDDSIIGSLDVDHSHYIVFDTLSVEGNVNISRRFLAMHTGIRPDKSYSENIIKNLDKKLQSLGFVEITDDPQVIFTESLARVEVGLRRRSANRFDGIAGVVYDEAAENSMRLTGQLNLFLINTLQRGEWMDLRWQGLGHGTQSLNISAGYPYLFYTPLTAEMEFIMRKQDSTYLHIRRLPAIGYRFQKNIDAGVFVDWQTSELLDPQKYRDAIELPPIIDYKTIFYGIRASYRSELFLIEPRKGFSYDIRFAAGNRNIKKNSSLPAHLYDDIDMRSTQYTGRISLQRIFPFMERSALMLKGEGGILLGDNIFDNELFRIGGLHSLRGFDEESLLASAYGYLLAEYRYVAGRNTYLSMFANGGFIERKTAGYYNDFPAGAGAGISQELPAGLLSLFFALGKRQNERVNFNDIKVHVGFVSTF